MDAIRKKLMYTTGIMDSLPVFIFTFSGVYVRVYIARHANVDDFALANILEAILGVIILQIVNTPKIINFLKRNAFRLSILATIMDLCRVYLIKDYSNISLIIGAINTSIFIETCRTGFTEWSNLIYTHTQRTILSLTWEKFSLIGQLLAMTLAYIFKDLNIVTVTIIIAIADIVILITDYIQYKLYVKYSVILNVSVNKKKKKHRKKK